MKSLRCACSLPCWHLSGMESKWTQENVAVWTLNKCSVVPSSSKYSAMVVLARGGTGCSPLFRSSKSLQFAGDGAHTRHCKGPDELSTAQGNPLNYISSSFSSHSSASPPHINSLPFLSISHWLEWWEELFALNVQCALFIWFTEQIGIVWWKMCSWQPSWNWYFGSTEVEESLKCTSFFSIPLLLAHI